MICNLYLYLIFWNKIRLFVFFFQSLFISVGVVCMHCMCWIVLVGRLFRRSGGGGWGSDDNWSCLHSIVIKITWREWIKKRNLSSRSLILFFCSLFLSSFNARKHNSTKY
jgi:hypothetical protein